jgi:hypothetical protein
MFKNFGFVFFHPCQLRGGEIARGVEEMLEAIFVAERVKGFVSVGYSAAVAPDNRGTKYL